MPGSSTTPGRPSACVGALGHIAFHYTDSVGTRNQFSIAAQWLACTFPCRRFADILADACARLGADVVRYSFIVVDLHHLLLAGLPAHPCKNSPDYGPDAILDPLYCGFGNAKRPASMRDISFSGTAFGFHTTSVQGARSLPQNAQGPMSDQVADAHTRVINVAVGSNAAPSFNPSKPLSKVLVKTLRMTVRRML